MVNKLASYNKATQNLMLQAMNLDVPSHDKFSLPEMVFLLRESFKQQLTYYRVFKERRPAHWDPATGFCLVSSYYIYSKTGGDKVWKFKQTPVHWWLEHRETNKIFDITHTQFSTPFPYDMGTDETRLGNDPLFLKMIQDKAMILGKSAGME